MCVFFLQKEFFWGGWDNKKLVLFQFRAPLIVLKNALWFCSQDGLPCWAWLTSQWLRKWHLTRPGLCGAVSGLGGQGSPPGAFPKPGQWDGASFSLLHVYNGPWYLCIWSMRPARDIALFWKAPMLDSILVPQLGVALGLLWGLTAFENLPGLAWNGHRIRKSVNTVSGGKVKFLFIWRGLQTSFNLIFKINYQLRMDREMDRYAIKKI